MSPPDSAHDNTDAGRARAGRWACRQDGAVEIAQATMVAPLLVTMLLLVLHGGQFLMNRQAVITAVAEGLRQATVWGGVPEIEGPSRVHALLDDHSTVTEVETVVTVDDLTGTVTLTVTARSPAVAPGLPRTITVTHSATRERWLP